MSNPIFDLDSWEPMFKLSETLAVDSKGKFSLRMGDQLAMDTDTGEMHFTTPWGSDSAGEDSDL